nr:OmpA family protein [Sphingomonas gellani]
MGLLAVAGATGFTADHGAAPFPPVKNRQVEGARPRGNYYLPWIVALIGLLLLFLLFRSCASHEQATTTTTTTAATDTAAPAVAPLPVEAVKLPNGRSVDLAPNTLNYELQRYLASNQPTPRTFTFDKLNFDTGSAAIRAEDAGNVDALALILAAYPKARVTVTGYTDARGSQPLNAQLGAQRAQAVATALTGKGIDKGRIATATGGESDPTDTNATAGGRFENRRSELTVTAK